MSLPFLLKTDFFHGHCPTTVFLGPDDLNELIISTVKYNFFCHWLIMIRTKCHAIMHFFQCSHSSFCFLMAFEKLKRSFHAFILLVKR